MWSILISVVHVFDSIVSSKLAKLNALRIDGQLLARRSAFYVIVVKAL